MAGGARRMTVMLPRNGQIAEDDPAAQADQIVAEAQAAMRSVMAETLEPILRALAHRNALRASLARLPPLLGNPEPGANPGLDRLRKDLEEAEAQSNRLKRRVQEAEEQARRTA